MKRLYRILFIAILTVSAVVEANATSRADTLRYEMCPGGSIQLGQRELKVYHDTIIVDTLWMVGGVDTLLKMHVVNLYQAFHQIENKSMVAGDSIEWQDMVLHDAGVYYSIHHTTDGECDSIFELNLRVYTIPGTKRYDTIRYAMCPGETLTIGQRQVKVQHDTIMVDTLRMVEGVDSLFRMHVVNLHQAFHLEEHKSILEGDSIEWQDTVLYEAGVYYKIHHTTVGGCDSIYELELSVHPVRHTEQSFYFCDKIYWNGKEYTESAVVYDTVALETGGFEIQRTNLDKAHSFRSIETKTLVQGDSITWHEQSIWHDGVFYDRHMTVHGCDSIYELHVEMEAAPVHTNTFVEQMAICHGDTIRWRERDIWVEGRYTDTVPGTEIDGKLMPDTIFVLNLTVWPSYKDTIIRHLYACGENASIEYQGETYTEDGVVTTTLPSVHGCDSVVKVYLHFNTALYLSDTVEIADTELPYKWRWQLSGEQRDTVLTTAGTFRHKESAQVGTCENVEELVLLVYPTYLYKDSLTICESDLPFHWLNGPRDHRNDALGQTVGTTKQYEYRYKTEHNTDSIFRLILTVDRMPKDTVYKYLCEGEMLRVGDRIYHNLKSDTVYKDSLFVPNRNNACDSLIYYNIYQYPQKKLVETAILHPDSTIQWHGNTITRPGTYNAYPDSIDTTTGCPMIHQLRVIQDEHERRVICRIDTSKDEHPDKRYPFVWQHHSNREPDTLYTSGTYYDTVVDNTGMITEFYSLDLVITQPYDTTINLHGCDLVMYRDKIYRESTTFVERVEVEPYNPEAPCDSVFHVNIKIDTSYYIYRADTICEHALPYIVRGPDGQIDSVYREGRTYHPFFTVNGCDSTIDLRLTILPDLKRVKDSAFVCSDAIKDQWYLLGDTVNPAFDIYREKVSEWKDKWIGVYIDHDSIVYNCDSTKSFHVIVRPSQEESTIPEKTFWLCPDDSIQLFLPYDTTWFYKDTIYEEVHPMTASWTDETHGYHYERDSYTCDSITRWFIRKHPAQSKDTTAHILVGDFIQWGDEFCSRTGVYEKIIESADTNSFGEYCPKTYRLHLYVDSAYYFRDTLSVCATPYKTYTHVWKETGHKQEYTVGDQDSIAPHYQVYKESFKTHDQRDSIYTLYVEYRLSHDTVLYRTICEGDSLEFNHHSFDINNNTTETVYLHESGVYKDVVKRITNGCDSTITLYLDVWPKTPTTHRRVDIADKDMPYLWPHSWKEEGTLVRDTDTIRVPGEHIRQLPSIHGCDSIDSLTLVVHKTYNIRLDTITICQSETPYIWEDLNEIRQSDEYTFRTQTHEGYDSIRTVYIKVLPVLYDTIRTHICEGDSARFGLKKDGSPRFVYRDNIYRDTAVSYQYGCDSITTLYLSVYPRYRHDSIRHIADTDSFYVWHHKAADGKIYPDDTLRAAGCYGFRYETAYGCDSIDSLTLYIHKTYRFTEEFSICASQTPYTWYDRNDITTSGTYIYNPRTIDGYDSIYIATITVDTTARKVVHYEICDNSLPFLFHGKELNKGGIYTDTLHGKNGCDSIVELHLTVNKAYYHFERRDIYEGDTVLFYGDTLTKTDKYIHDSITPSGCDSIHELQLVVHPKVDTTAIVCSSSLPFAWRNRWTGETTWLNTAGIYHNDTSYVNGERTFWSIELIVKNPTYKTVPVSICEGSEYIYNGDTLRTGGEYPFHLTSSGGCDSIVTIVLTVHSGKTQTDYTTIFEGDSVLFHDEWYKQSGIYEYRNDNTLGCEDIHQLVLTVVKQINVDTVANVCENELPYIWHGIEYSAAGVYSVPTTWTDSARVVTTLTLNVLPVPREERVKDICEGDAFVYKNKQFTTNTIFYDTILSQIGCDSIIKYIIRVHPVYDRLFERHISDKDTVMFHGTVLKSEGTYEWTGQAAFGCDSMEHLMLYVHPSYFFLDSVELCEPDTFMWHGQAITKAGLYYDSLVTKQYNYKFDSVYHLIVKTHPYYMFNEKYEIGEGEIIKLHGRDISKPGEYWDTLYTVHGCDSIFHIVVNKKHTIEFSSNLQICQTETPYLWHNMSLTRSGAYTYVSQYKDSIVRLNLTVNPISISEERVVITPLQRPYLYQGRLYDDLPEEGAKLYTDTLSNQYGCDSIHRLAIVVTKRYSVWNPIPLCPGSELIIDGQRITTAGLYSFVRRSYVTGEMDSLYRVEVYDAPAFDLPTEQITICEGDTVFMAGKAITRAGHYDFNLKTKDGCDSLLHLDLTVNPSYHFYEYVSVPDYSPYEWFGRIYGTSGIYNRHWRTEQNCDSIYTLDLTVIPTLRDTIEETICVGQSLNWRGKKYDLDGYYTDTIWTPETGYSALYSLRLHVAYPTIITSARTGDICADAETFDIFFEYTGEKPTHYNVYFDQLAHREGFEDVIDAPFGNDLVAHVALPQFSSVAYQGHPYYVRPDYYTMHIALDNGVCGINRSDSLTLLVKYPNWIIEQNWTEVVAPLTAEYNGGYEFSKIEWRVNGVLQTNTPAGYLYNKEMLPGDQVVMFATRQGESVAIPTCPLTIQSPMPQTYSTPVIIYPTQAPRQMPAITIEAPEQGRYEVFSATGLMLTSGTFEEGKTAVMLPAVNGIYFIRTIQGKDFESHKVIVY